MRKKSIISLIILIFLACIGLFLYRDFYSTGRKMYSKHWGITVPRDFKTQYYITSFGMGAHDGESYEIFTSQTQYQQENECLTKEMSSEKDMGMQNEVITILKSLKVNTEEYPTFSNDLQWKILISGNNRLYILHDSQSLSWYVVQFVL